MHNGYVYPDHGVRQPFRGGADITTYGGNKPKGVQKGAIPSDRMTEGKEGGSD